MFKKFIAVSAVIAWLALPSLGLAQSLLSPDLIKNMGSETQKFGDKSFDTNIDDLTLSNYIGAIIMVFLSIMATIFIILIVIAGFNWMTAAGDKDKVTRAQLYMRNAVIGLLIMVTAYAITYWIFSRLPDSRF